MRRYPLIWLAMLAVGGDMVYDIRRKGWLGGKKQDQDDEKCSRARRLGLTAYL